MNALKSLGFLTTSVMMPDLRISADHHLDQIRDSLCRFRRRLKRRPEGERIECRVDGMMRMDAFCERR